MTDFNADSFDMERLRLALQQHRRDRRYWRRLHPKPEPLPLPLPFVYDDGGRAAAGFAATMNGASPRDCAARSIAIASGRPYAAVYAALAAGTGTQRASRLCGKREPTACEGINTHRKWFKEYMRALGAVWTPTFGHGKRTVRLCVDAYGLPPGRLAVYVRHHVTAVIDGVIHDTHDPNRGGARCVYGFWSFPEQGSIGTSAQRTPPSEQH